MGRLSRATPKRNMRGASTPDLPEPRQCESAARGFAVEGENIMHLWQAIVIVALVAIVCGASVLAEQKRADEAIAEAERRAEDQNKLLDEVEKKSREQTQRILREIGGDEI